MLITLVIAGSGGGCASEGATRELRCPSDCGDDCTGDVPCTDAGYCPMGSSCELGPDGGEPIICEPHYFPDVPAGALLDGFHAKEFPLTRDPSSAGQFMFEILDGSRFVTCGLFVAEPQFRDGAIINAGAAIARSRIFRIDEEQARMRAPTLRLDELRRPGESGSSVEVCGAISNGSPFPDEPDYPLVETLHLGCWAVGLDQVIGASTLLSIAPSELPDSSTLPLASCDETLGPTAGAYCMIAWAEGVCRGSICKVGIDAPVVDKSVAPTHSCGGKSESTFCLAAPSRAVGRCYAGGCIDQNVKALHRPLVVTSCEQATSDWLNCFPSPLGTIGTCYANACRPRCHSQKDCEVSAKYRAKPRTTEACVRPPLPDSGKTRSYLGICAPEAP